MIVIPAIDLKDGRCVRLEQGLMERDTVFNDNPAAQALEWQRQGAELLHIVEQINPAQYPGCFPDPISEDTLRDLKFRFNSLQSLYDTHVSQTEIEFLDTDLPILRGHVSIVFHLLEIATLLVHYYERHLNALTGDLSLRRKPVISAEALLGILMNYSIAYAGRYLSHGRHFCHTMLKRYAEVGKIEVPVPSYRGFHVRPATLTTCRPK